MAIAETVRKYVEAGREALSQKKAEDLARSLAKQGEIRRDQVAKLARDLTRWSRQSSERLLEIIRGEVKKQITRAGVATRDEVDSLRRRVRDLERGGKKPATSKRTTAKRSTASGSSRKTSASKRT
jgi:polyhydroxyalkanoate synthesis regulator phasin